MKILDHCAGSGAFLVKAMANMIKEVGGVNTKYNTHQWIDSKEYLSYQKPQKPFEIYEEDFKKTIIDFILFEEKIDVKEFNEKLLNQVLYKSEYKDGKLMLDVGGENEENKD